MPTDILLFIATGLIAYFTFSQVGVSKQALKDQQDFSTKQIDRLDSQLSLSRKSTISQDTFQVHFLDTLGRQISIASKQMQTSLCAYLNIRFDSLAFGHMQTQGREFAAFFSLENNGQTPAYSIIQKPAQIYFIDSGQKVNLNSKDVDTLKGIIPAKSIKYNESRKWDVSTYSDTRMREGKRTYYIRVQYDYLDIFNRQRFIWGLFEIANVDGKDSYGFGEVDSYGE